MNKKVDCGNCEKTFEHEEHYEGNLTCPFCKYTSEQCEFPDTNIRRGWILSNNENDNIVIQKYDESNRFKNDDEATEFVVKHYDEMVVVILDLIVAHDLKSDKSIMDLRIKLAKDVIKKLEG